MKTHLLDPNFALITKIALVSAKNAIRTLQGQIVDFGGFLAETKIFVRQVTYVDALTETTQVRAVVNIIMPLHPLGPNFKI